MRIFMLVGLCYGLSSLITFAVYAVDKSAARTGGRRVPERTLHLLALLGGWPGALLARQWLRHKSRKPRFSAMLWLTVLGNVALAVLLTSVQGGRWVWLH
ncbi:MAG: DUF1294 domain-containing protein [Hylemonella sp.]|nr:DUF1294 domain-containing protein [Hylemonella sp.]MDP1936864.1 DUF1294 domain-containing protein [Hylemonella sp.]